MKYFVIIMWSYLTDNTVVNIGFSKWKKTYVVAGNVVRRIR